MNNASKDTAVSRRTVIIATAAAAPLLVLTTGGAEAKISQAAVKYQKEPKDGKQCADCNFFEPPNACKQVAGEIVPTGWCLLWVKKAAS